jgi:hypothetical protein
MELQPLVAVTLKLVQLVDRTELQTQVAVAVAVMRLRLVTVAQVLSFFAIQALTQLQLVQV